MNSQTSEHPVTLRTFVLNELCDCRWRQTSGCDWVNSSFRLQARLIYCLTKGHTRHSGSVALAPDTLVTVSQRACVHWWVELQTWPGETEKDLLLCLMIQKESLWFMDSMGKSGSVQIRNTLRAWRETRVTATDASVTEHSWDISWCLSICIPDTWETTFQQTLQYVSTETPLAAGIWQRG